MIEQAIKGIARVAGHLLIWSAGAQDQEGQKEKEVKLSSTFKFRQNKVEKNIHAENTGDKALHVVFTKRLPDGSVGNNSFKVPRISSFVADRSLEVYEDGDVTVAELNPHNLRDADAVKSVITFFARSAAIGAPIYVFGQYLKSTLTKDGDGSYIFKTEYDKPIVNWKLALEIKNSKGDIFKFFSEKKANDQSGATNEWTIKLPPGLVLETPIFEAFIKYDEVPTKYYEEQIAEIERERNLQGMVP